MTQCSAAGCRNASSSSADAIRTPDLFSASLRPGPSNVRLVQCKQNESLSGCEREQLKALPVPANVRREYWRFVDGEPGKPRIEIL